VRDVHVDELGPRDGGGDHALRDHFRQVPVDGGDRHIVVRRVDVRRILLVLEREDGGKTPAVVGGVVRTPSHQAHVRPCEIRHIERTRLPGEQVQTPIRGVADVVDIQPVARGAIGGHVGVDHRHDVLARAPGVVGAGRRTVEPELLGSEGDETDRAFERPLDCENARGFHHRGRPRGVVVGTGRERRRAGAVERVVVGTDHDPLVRIARAGNLHEHVLVIPVAEPLELRVVAERIEPPPDHVARLVSPRKVGATIVERRERADRRFQIRLIDLIDDRLHARVVRRRRRLGIGSRRSLPVLRQLR